MTLNPAHAAELDGARLGLGWTIPFVGILLSIALMPLLAPKVWHAHFGKISAGWSLATLLPLAVLFGPAVAAGAAWHTLLLEYLPFLIFIGALYVVASGIHISGNLHGAPGLNTTLLAIGALLASVMGTTGASMLLISPLIRANDNRRYRVHTIVFFIFIVANIGGSLTPLGDPPLFLGFLKGVDFFWTLKHMAGPMLLQLAVLLPLFYAIDTVLYRRDVAQGLKRDPTPDTPIGLSGKCNFLFLAVLVATVVLTGLWRTPRAISIGGVEYSLPGLVRDVVFIVVAMLSLKLTPRSAREANQFSWGPIKEVAKIFLGIFLTMAPVIVMLRAGSAGAFAPIVSLVTNAQGELNNAMYFWLTGALSSFLDNAPTYLVFFNLAGGDPSTLMTSLAGTLTAISAGAVFMGANTYIGNAPNFMVKSIAESRGIAMPGFFGYMAWSIVILLPLFGLTT
ncbi:MAG TPA: sodium:proton antiporter, partial [Burkholderiaceae bacterium]|nr:sodium:proton antiporter [Burkholderiaceae bacterium]